ncbi:MAG: pilus assembly protein PilM [Candidatus Paceibacterota bacterium]|jgi:type IV pilus assembly protein PilM
MFKSLYKRFFPTPHFISAPSFGVDISEESLRFVELVNTRHGIRLGKYGEVKIPKGVIESGKIIKPNVLQEILVKIKKEQGVKSVRVSLPEEQIYLFKLRLEKDGLKNIKEGVELCLEEHVPVPAPEAVFDYEILNETEKFLEIQVAVVQKNITEGYLSIFESSGISVSAFEFEAQSIARAVIKEGDLDTYMIVDFGENRTGISIVSHGVIMFTSTLDVGGEMLTNLIQKNFKIGFEEAEKIKKQHGLQRNAVNKEMFSVLLNGVSILRDEIGKHFIYWHTHKDEFGKDNPPIKKIILCGGNSNLIGLSEYFSITMKNSVELANVWINILNVEKIIPEINFEQSLSFVVALGLALGNFKND